MPTTVEERRAQQVAPSLPTSTGPAFFAGIAATGPIGEAVKVTTPDEYLSTFGSDAAGAALLSHSVETALEEGAPEVWVGRVDDLDLVVTADWQAALDLFVKNYGPGQVAAPGNTTLAVQTALTVHAAANNRTALLDPNYQDSVAAVTTLAGALGGLVNADRAGLFAQWLQIPQKVAGVDRFVPPSAVVAGLSARVDGLENRQPNHERGRTRFATGLVPSILDADRNALYTAGANAFLDDGLGIRLDGFRSVTTDPDWFDLAHNRLFMAIEGLARSIDLQYLGDRITGATITQFQGELEGMVETVYKSGALFGDTSEDAYDVDTADPINSPATAAARELNANIRVRPAEHADLVRTIHIKVPVTEPVTT